MTNPARRYPALIGLVFLVALMAARGVDAKTFMCAAGDVSCLIQAINEANSNGHPRNTIHLAPGTYTLMSVENVTDGPNGLPSITSTLKIDAPLNELATITVANSLRFRLFHVAATGHLTLERIALSGGVGSGSGGGAGGVFNAGGVVIIRGCTFTANSTSLNIGGGLLNLNGKVIIRNSTFAHNSAADGGGLWNNGDVTIVDSMFESNLAQFDGGAILNDANGIVRIKRSRFSRNGASSGGGGAIRTGHRQPGNPILLIDTTTFEANGGATAGAIIAGGTLSVTNSAFVENTVFLVSGGPAISNAGTAAVTNTTFARNGIEHFASGGALAVSNGGILVLTNDTFADHTGRVFEPILLSAASATTILVNTILTHNPGDATVQDCRGPVISLGHNVISDPSGCAMTLQPRDQTGDAGLDTFTDDGTPGNGHFPLLKDSQAVDAGNDAFCPRRDQIGQLRKGQCDIGAIEFQPKKHSHHGWNDDDHDEREDSWSRDQLDEGFDRPNGNAQTPEP